MQVASSPANFDIELRDGLVSLESEQQNGVVDDPTKVGLVCASEGKFHTKYVTPRLARILSLINVESRLLILKKNSTLHAHFHPPRLLIS